MTFHPFWKKRRHQSTSSPYMKNRSSSSPTCSIADLLSTQKQPLITSTGLVSSKFQNVRKKLPKRRDLGNRVSSATARHSVFQRDGKPMQFRWNLPSVPRTLGPSM